jgi:hypothetical protein
MPVREKGRRGPGSQRARPFSRPHASTDRRKSAGSSGTAAECTAQTDSPLEGNGFEPSVPRVMGGDLGWQVPALIAVFELAGTAVALQRGTKVVRPDRHPEFR